MEFLHPENCKGYAAYPPVVENAEILGYVNDSSGIFQSRDIGVPFQLAGRTYLIFGDTFYHDSSNEFMGLVCNTAAMVMDPCQPTETTYDYRETKHQGQVQTFIPLTEAEKELEKKGDKSRFFFGAVSPYAEKNKTLATIPGAQDKLKQLGEHFCKKQRVALWPFGGLVELEDKTARVWFSKCVFHGNKEKYIGTGVVKVIAIGCQGGFFMERSDDEVIFGPDEPRVGTFASITDGEYIYLYGDQGHNDIILARIKKTTNMLDKNMYTYWNGKEYVGDPKVATTIFANMCQGAVVRSKLFGPDVPFLFVGVNGTADSKVMMAASATLEGPWQPRAVYEAKGVQKKDGFMYCVYPHIWASKEEGAELVVSWSEGYPGGVVMARLTLAPVGGGTLNE